MPVLVDGDNLLGSWPGRDRSEASRTELVAEVRGLARRERRRLVLVFDGEPPWPAAAGPDVRWSGRGRTADDLILEILRGEPDRRGWTVVTNDRSLGDQCRWLEARLERCERFRQRLAHPSGKEKPERVGDVEEWLRVFGEDGPDEPSP
jgi:hypothetical protein